MEPLDLKCGYDVSLEVIQKIANKRDINFPEAYTRWDSMAFLSKELKKHDNSEFCILPHCHTIEGEALGGRINFGDINAGPRVKEFVYYDINGLLGLGRIDFTKGRIAEVLKACKYLREEGEMVALSISGPFTILNLLIDLRHVFKAIKKDAKAIEFVFEKLQDEILSFIVEAQRVGVNLISYGDPVGGENILGPMLSKQVIEAFTYPLLRKVQGVLRKDVLVLLCPKTALALLGAKRAVAREINFNEPIKYSEACIKVINEVGFVGQTCINNKNSILKDGIIRAIDLVQD